MGVAFTLYAQDFDDVLPAPGGYGGSFWTQIRPDGGSDLLDPFLAKRDVKAKDVWACPNLQSGTLDAPPKGDPWYYLNFKRSYGMNTFLRSAGQTVRHKYAERQKDVVDPDAFNPNVDPNGMETLSFLAYGISRAAIPQASATVLLYEGIPVGGAAGAENAAHNGYVSRHGDWRFVGGYWRTAEACAKHVTQNGRYPGQACQDPGLRAWHGETNNFLYCDGHVRAERPVQEGWKPTRERPGGFLVRHCREEGSPCP